MGLVGRKQGRAALANLGRRHGQVDRGLRLRPDRSADPALQELVEHGISCILKGQKEDGYIYPNALPRGKRWANLKDQHEFYEIGHDIEGAVAYYQATGRRQFLDAICRAVDLMDANFGPEEGKKKGYDGHEEIELALAKLYKATGNERYLKLCKFFVDERGKSNPHYFDVEAATRDPQAGVHQGDYAYYQAGKPLRKMDEVVGHAVRCMYICTGMANVAALTGDDATPECVPQVVGLGHAPQDVRHRRSGLHDARRGIYRQLRPAQPVRLRRNLPRPSAWCSSHRMVQLEADAKYADVLERALYNGTISGVSADERSSSTSTRSCRRAITTAANGSAARAARRTSRG